MANEPKLTVYTIRIKPITNEVQNSNRWLLRNLINEANNNPLDDSYIFLEAFKKFITALDQPEMFSDENSKKSMTANQADIAEDGVEQNITPHFQDYIIEGRVTGGPYGRKRKRISIQNKSDNSNVSDKDAITDDYYFFVYMPPASNKMILMIQSYEGASIDSVFKSFWYKFLSIPNVFDKPSIQRFIPESIISSFKQDSTVSCFQYSTDVTSKTLFQKSVDVQDRTFKVTIKITPTDGDLSVEEFENTAPLLDMTKFAKRLTLGQFGKKKGSLRDNMTNKQSPFKLDSNFHIKPVILLSKFISFPHGKIDFGLIKNYCFELLEEVKPKIFPQNAVQER